MSTSEQQRWNHNIHYFDVLLDAVPFRATSGLDVGCGGGMLARRLRERVERVVAIDLNAEQIALARAETLDDDAHRVEYILGDVMTHDFGQTFDVVMAVVMLHHLDSQPALERLTALVAPGGVLAIEGVARSTRPSDLIHNVGGFILTRVLKHTGGRRFYMHSAPIVWPPKDSYADIRRIAAAALPGARYQRHLLWRYTLIWQRP